MWDRISDKLPAEWCQWWILLTKQLKCWQNPFKRLHKCVEWNAGVTGSPFEISHGITSGQPGHSVTWTRCQRSGLNEWHLAPRCSYSFLPMTIMGPRVKARHFATHNARRALATPPPLHLVALGTTCVNLTMRPQIWLRGSGHIYLALTVTLQWFLNPGTSAFSQCCQSNQPFKEG